MPYDPAREPGRPANVGPSDPATKGVAITPSDTLDLTVYPRALWVGVVGDVAFVPLMQADDTPVVAKGVQGVLPWRVRRVFATGTTATSILGMID